jgi:hypothetical protein
MSEKPTKKSVEDAFAAAVKEDNLCNLGRLLAEVDPEVRKVIEAKVQDTLHYSAATISRVLKGLGFPPVSSESVSKHRKGACRCQ